MIEREEFEAHLARVRAEMPSFVMGLLLGAHAAAIMTGETAGRSI
jgi:hypothetical protein